MIDDYATIEEYVRKAMAEPQGYVHVSQRIVNDGQKVRELEADLAKSERAVATVTKKLAEWEAEDIAEEKEVWACIEEGNPDWYPDGQPAYLDAISEIRVLRSKIKELESK